MTIRDYPLFCGDNIMITYNEIRFEHPDMLPKDAWDWSEHLHRKHPRNQKRVEEIKKNLKLFD